MVDQFLRNSDIIRNATGAEVAQFLNDDGTGVEASPSSNIINPVVWSGEVKLCEGNRVDIKQLLGAAALTKINDVRKKFKKY